MRWMNKRLMKRPLTALRVTQLEDRIVPAVSLVRDIFIGSTNFAGEPSDFVAVGSTTFFVATSNHHGRELWKTDGTSSGTVLVADILPGSGSSFPAQLTNVNGILYFRASDGVHGTELWRSNGTSSGTFMVGDIRPGPDSSTPDQLTVNSSGVLYFTANDGVHGTEPWILSSGVLQMIADIRFGSTGSNPTGMTTTGNRVYYAANNGFNGTELYVSLGPNATLLEINPGSASASPSQLTCMGGSLYFSANDGINGVELWRSNGTESGTTLVRDIRSGSGNSYPGGLHNYNGTLVFRANDGTNGSELWRSNGTSTGTTLIRDIRAGSAGSIPSSFATVGTTLFFLSDNGTTGFELWRSNGTSSGTSLVRDIVSGSGTPFNVPFLGNPPDQLYNESGTLYFVANTVDLGSEVWKSDGTSTGTTLFFDLMFGSGSYPSALASTQNGLFFNADNIGLSRGGRRISGGVLTSLTRSYSGNNDDALGNLTSAANTLFFTANFVNSSGTELWRSNGTSSGTTLVKDINPGSLSAFPNRLTSFNNLLIFSANDGTTGAELWRSDGTSSGTTLIKDIQPGANGSIQSDFTEYNGKLYFFANDGIDPQLWRTDGTSTGTSIVTLLPTDNYTIVASNPPTEFDGLLYFAMSTNGYGFELWTSNGTNSGTSLVQDINPGSSSSSIGNITPAAGKLFFTANDGINGQELWITDGTSTGTRLLRDIRPGSESSGITGLTAFGNLLYFVANDGTHGSELWRSDGTSPGTYMISDLRPGMSGSSPNQLTIVGSRLYFTADDGYTGREIYFISDDAPDQIVKGAEAYTGSGSSNPQSLANVNGTLYFTAYSLAEGRELYRYNDSTLPGNVNLVSIVPGSGDALPSSLIEAGGVLYLEAMSTTAGRSLHRLDGGLPPRITSNGGEHSQSFYHPENQKHVTMVTAIDPNGGPITYSISGGFDADKFTINPTTGELSFIQFPDYEAPIDHNFNNVYNVQVKASNGVQFDTQTLGINIVDREHNQPLVYVNGVWSALTNGTVIADADPFEPGNQPATVGINAFVLLEHGIDVVAVNGTLTLLPGTYPDPANLAVEFKLRTHPGVTDITGKLSGLGRIYKTGIGPLFLSAANTYKGETYIERGTIGISADTALGLNPSVQVGPFGNLAYVTSATTSRMFSLGGSLEIVSPATLTFDNAAVAGGFLKGGGTLATSAAGSSFFYGTQAAATLSIQANGNDQFFNFSNSAKLTGAIGKTHTLSNFANEPGGRLVLNGTTSVSSFATTGQMTVSGSMSVFEGSGPSSMVFGGGSLTTINAGASINTGSKDALVTSAYVLNKGSFGNASSNIIIDYNGKVEGNAVFGGLITKNGGIFSPGASPGPASTHSFHINGGGRLEFEITNATGTAAALSGWDMVAVQPTTLNSNATLSFSATAASKFTLVLAGRNNSGDFDTPGAIANFNSALPHAWKFVDASAAAVAGTFDANAFAVDTSGFLNAFTGGFGVELRDGGKNLYVVYTPPAGPSVTNIIVNNDLPQRSLLTTIQVNFQNPVDAAAFTGPGAITLTRTGPLNPGTLVQTGATGANGRILVSPAAGLVSSLVLMFDNANGAPVTAGVEAGSLTDGYWQLAIPAANYLSPLNSANLRRVFGDSDGNGTIDATDFAEFGATFGTSGVGLAFDFDGNGTIDSTDFAAFGSRFGLSL